MGLDYKAVVMGNTSIVILQPISGKQHSKIARLLPSVFSTQENMQAVHHKATVCTGALKYYNRANVFLYLNQAFY